MLPPSVKCKREQRGFDVRIRRRYCSIGNASETNLPKKDLQNQNEISISISKRDMDSQSRTEMDNWLTVAEAAHYLRLSERSIRRHATDLGGVRYGSSEKAPLRFKRSRLDKWANRHRLRSGESDPEA